MLVHGGRRACTQGQLASSSDVTSRPAQHTPKSTRYFKGKLLRLVVSHAGGFRGRGQSQTNAKGTWLSEIALIQQMRNQHTKQPVGWERTFYCLLLLVTNLSDKERFPWPWTHPYYKNRYLLCHWGLVLLWMQVTILTEFWWQFIFGELVKTK